MKRTAKYKCETISPSLSILNNGSNLRHIIHFVIFMDNIEPSNKRKMMTPDEVANILSVAKITIYRIMSKRQIKFSKIGGRIRFKTEDVERYIEDNSTETMKKHF